MVSRRQIITKANHQLSPQVASDDEELRASSVGESRRQKGATRCRQTKKSNVKSEEFNESETNQDSNQEISSSNKFDVIKNQFDQLTRQQQIRNRRHQDNDKTKAPIPIQSERERVGARRKIAPVNTTTAMRPSDNHEFHESLLDDALSFNWAGQSQDSKHNSKFLKRTTTTNNHQQQQARGQRSRASALRNGDRVHEEDDGEEEELAPLQDMEHQELDAREAKAVAKAASYEDDQFCQTDDLYRNFDPYSIYGDEDDEEDVWYSEEKLKQDHIQEIVNKWHSIDDEIWAKIICMEQNRRIAKAYARQHTININGSKDDYLDGTTLGLNSFENPDRDSKTSYIKQYIGEGIKLKIHQNGDIFVKRLSRSNVFVHHFKPTPISSSSKTNQLALKGSQSSSDLYALNSGESGEGLGDFYGVVRPRQDKVKRRQDKMLLSKMSLGLGIGIGGGFKEKNSGSSSGASSQTPSTPTNKSSHLNKPGHLLQAGKVVRLFSMAKFKQALEFESRKSTPNRDRLLNMCISIVSFVMNDQKMLNLPSWIMVINIVAMDLLSSEIGLVEPYADLMLSTPLSPPSQTDLSAVDRWTGTRGVEHEELRINRAPNKLFDCFRDDDYDDHGYENDLDEDKQGEEYCAADEDDDNYNSKFNGFPNSRRELGAPRTGLERGPVKQANDDECSLAYSDVEDLGECCANQEDDDDLHIRDHKVAKNFASNKTKEQQAVTSIHARAQKKLSTRGGTGGTEAAATAQETNSDGELTNHHHYQTRSKNPANGLANRFVNSIDGPPTNCVEQLGSSSSGFISSHHNDDSSANSSSSNIAHSDRPLNQIAQMTAKADSALALKPSRFRQKQQLGAGKEREMTSKSETNTTTDGSTGQQQQVAPIAMLEQVGRHKRASNLARGRDITDPSQLDDRAISSGCNEPVIMSDPIPIPAPPTSAGGPSGKANLILVSPTGLSPPTAKKLHYNSQSQAPSKMAQRDTTYACGGPFQDKQHEQEQATSAADSRLAPKEAKQALKLPLGIPAHAQLAPPATRRHILRYLMSTGARPSGSAQTRHQQQQPKVAPAPSSSRRRAQRPLPGLPPNLRHHHHQQQHQQQSDESLYYRGLQARAMQARPPASQLSSGIYGVRHWIAAQSGGGTPKPPPPPPLPLPMQQPHVTGPMDVTNIICNFKNNALFRQQLAKHSQQQHLMNVTSGGPPQTATTRPSQTKHDHQLRRKANNNKETSKPKGDNFGLKQRSSELRRPFMRSLDSLHVKTAPNSSNGGFHLTSLSTLLNSVGNLLKGSSGGKSKPAAAVSRQQPVSVADQNSDYKL